MRIHSIVCSDILTFASQSWTAAAKCKTHSWPSCESTISTFRTPGEGPSVSDGLQAGYDVGVAQAAHRDL